MKHERFIYHGYTIDSNGFEFHFSMDEYEFRPKWQCAVPLAEDATLRELVFNLGMVELISYWKAACPPVVEVRCGCLSEWQVNWWKKLYRNGLGEFFYVNNIVADDDFMTIEACAASVAPLPHSTTPRKLSGCLIPVGGGKDSIVTLELLAAEREQNCCYIAGDIKRAYDSAKVAGYPDSRIIQVNRTIDSTLLELNKKGYLNGHTPFSAVIAFSSLIFAYVTGKKYIVLSNESSANEGNVNNSDVNHQYSKSTEFERDFREYIAKTSVGIEYFSFLRPLNELQITQKFTRFPKYFPIFQSCNVGTKTNTWCCKCAKCLYVYVMLAAFLDDSDLEKIFSGENLLNNPDLAITLNALANPSHDKPFECVGTRKEVKHAIYMAVQRRIGKLPLLLEQYADGETLTDYESSELLSFFDSEHFVPQEFLPLLKI